MTNDLLKLFGVSSNQELLEYMENNPDDPNVQELNEVKEGLELLASEEEEYVKRISRIEVK